MGFIKNISHKNKIMILAGIGLCAVIYGFKRDGKGKSRQL